jgi:hypothetical protein
MILGNLRKTVSIKRYNLDQLLLMARISVTTSTPVGDNTWRYNVGIIENDGSGSKTNHEVIMNKEYYLAQTGGRIIPEEFVKKSFEFLLEREDKNSILQRFDIQQINDYFPEYEKEIKK